MKTILFAWELGANLGHLTRDLPLARACRDAGYRVVFAVRNLRIASTLFKDEGFLLLQAPTLKSPIKRAAAPVNFPDMLLHEGYDDAEGLHAALLGWEGVYRIAQPSLLIHDHAPTALIAARCLGIPALIVGTGFEVPPAVYPQPGFRPWQSIPPAILAEAEGTAVAQINRQLQRRNVAAINRLADLYTELPTFLATFPELDHFGPRTGGHYIGPLYALGALEGAQAQSAAWERPAGKPRVFAYLRIGMTHCEQILAALQQCDAETICAIPGAPPEWAKRYDKLHIHAHPVDLHELLKSAHAVIAYGAGTIATSLLAGVPVLLLPQLAEQYLAGLALERSGAGVMLRDQSAASFAAALNALLNDTTFTKAATAFASRHAEFDMERSCRILRDAVDDIVLSRARAAATQPESSP